MEENKLTIIELTEENIESMIYEIRGQRVMLDFDLARIYGYETKYLNRQVQRNIEKFDEDFMFRLSIFETETLVMCQNVTSRNKAFFSGQEGGTRKLPYAFTEKGIYMLMTVLRGELAIKQSKTLIRLFEKMKNYIVTTSSVGTINELVKLSNKVNEHDEKLIDIKNELKVVMDNFVDPSKYKHFLILNGERFQADVAYQQIYGLARKSIYIIDDYINYKTLQLLKACRKDIEITVCSDNKSTNNLSSYIVEDFLKETDFKITFKKNGGLFHDRYIVIDYSSDKETIYHCGASSKDAGNKVATIMKIDDKDAYHHLIEMINNLEPLCL